MFGDTGVSLGQSRSHLGNSKAEHFMKTKSCARIFLPALFQFLISESCSILLSNRECSGGKAQDFVAEWARVKEN